MTDDHAVAPPTTLADESARELARVTAALPGGGEQREGQIRMARAVADAIESRGHVAVQAGTGTGKSLAYLVPAALSGTRTVIATATKALQDQLATKDLPFLNSQLEAPIDFAVLKGRSNYLCRQRLDEIDTDDRLAIDVPGEDLDPVTVESLREFAHTAATGDRVELTAEVSDRQWRAVTVGRDECPGAARCPRGEDCFAEAARARAGQADVVVVNLHLYALHVTTNGILDSHDLVIIDEAHQLEDIVAEAAGRSLTPGRCNALARAASAVLADREVCDDLDSVAGDLRDLLATGVGSRLDGGPDPDLAALVDLVRSRVDQVVQALRAVPDDAPIDTRTKTLRARQAATALLDDIEILRFPTDHDVLWIDGPASNAALRSTPISVSEMLAEQLWSRRPAVLTSATLGSDAAQRVGLPGSAELLDVGSPFDYPSQALLYCPTDLPDPRDDDGRERGLAELEALVVAAGGRTLALFTSLAAMRSAAEQLGPRLPWPVLVQGEQSKAQLLERFAEDVESSLFATMSFWQGVDVPGPSCSLVVIDRLPFPRPDDPVLAARRDRAGRDAFRTIDLPRAATMLAQGAGRLVRSATDRGVVAVLDPRLATARSYRWDLIAGLPPMRRTKDRAEVIEFLRSVRDESDSPTGAPGSAGEGQGRGGTGR